MVGPFHPLYWLIDTNAIAGNKNANRLVADDPEREERRSILKERKERLEQAGDRLRQMNRAFFEQNAASLV
jgi:hypothetical protein